MIGKFKINFGKVEEQDFIEGIFNHSNQIDKNFAIFMLSLFAMDKQWKIDKFLHYLNLLEKEENVN